MYFLHTFVCPGNFNGSPCSVLSPPPLTHTVMLRTITVFTADWSEYIIEDDAANTADNGYDDVHLF